MRKICLAVLIAAFACPFALADTTATTEVSVGAPQPKEHYVKYDKAEEHRMIKDNRLYSYYTVKVTTTNQKKFDKDKDGYLSGVQLEKYLRAYYYRW